ncbi:CGNR zinc finger domain-containing protein [Glycomyces tritici]|uniref:ABATE domain-containing protein n=1 Tax=Glycomyces tritici TaxID=2665176 RepID=A0ABT7YSH7_9ACTN|nr:ABATE domain-containing protein [Glycomyces tritici]MDN3241602.1 ABATE domain-containing protein [Glycomyces tritici]
MPALLLPGEPTPVRLMNTVWADRSGLHDDLETAADLRTWIDAVGPAAAEVGDGDLARFRSLRDALRRLAAFATEDTRPAAASPLRDLTEAVAEVNRAAALAPGWPVLELDGDALARRFGSEGDPVSQCLASLAVQGIELLTGPGREDLRACYGPGCVLYFAKDHPRREWCSAGCGNRARAARHYARHRTAAEG